MFIRIFGFLIGFGFSTIGFVFIISYLNLLSIVYNFSEYVHFICSSPQCLIGPIGLIIITLVIFLPKGDNNDLHIRYSLKMNTMMSLNGILMIKSRI